MKLGFDTRFVFVLVALTLTSPHAANADMLDECREAIEANDLETVEKLTLKILSVYPFPVDRLEETRSCFAAVDRADIVYDDETKRISYSEALLAEMEAKRQSELAALEAAEAAKSARRDAVLVQTIHACRTLFDQDRIAALTSEVCHPIFMATGLPD